MIANFFQSLEQHQVEYLLISTRQELQQLPREIGLRRLAGFG
jgi:hypothetical protein